MRNNTVEEPRPTDSKPANCVHGNHHRLHGLFRVCSQTISNAAGSVWAFAIAILVIAGWAAVGPIFHFSDTWQLVINTATTIVTFLMVFLIQNTQNRDTKAIHLKLDELLRGVKGARTSMVDLEDLSDDELDRLKREFERLRGRTEKVRHSRTEQEE